jgi:hypothetical protein
MSSAINPFVDLSIIVPAYNEEHRLPPTLAKLDAFLRTQPLRYEIVVVDDGSKDNTCVRRRRLDAARRAAKAPRADHELQGRDRDRLALRRGCQDRRQAAVLPGAVEPPLQPRDPEVTRAGRT